MKAIGYPGICLFATFRSRTSDWRYSTIFPYVPHYVEGCGQLHSRKWISRYPLDRRVWVPEGVRTL